MKKPSESGRSIVEIIAILVLMMLLILTGLWGFKHAVLSARVHTMSKDLSTAVTERRYEIARSGTSKPHKLTTKVGSTQMTIQNRTEGERDFFVTISNMTPETCEEMKKYNVFKPKAIGAKKKNGAHIEPTVLIDEINCAEIISLDFYFDPSDGGGHDGNGGGGGVTPTPNPGPNPLAGNCDGKKCPTCKRCDAMTGQCVNENDGVYIEECGICQSGEPVQDGEDTDCQTFNTTTGKCKDKTDACHYCDTTNNSWKWLEGKENYTTCGNQCCEFGCDETDNTKCKALNCSFGTQTYAHNAIVGNCGICHNGVVEPKDAVDVCHTCDATTSWNLTLKEKGKETVCGTQCCQKCDPNNPNQCAPVQECMKWDSESETYVADTSTETCCKKHGKIWNKTKQTCNTGCEEGENLCTSKQGNWCCATGCGETYETCCSKGTCCADRHTPYCPVKFCLQRMCCNGKYVKMNNVEGCCPSGQTPYYSIIYYANGTAGHIGCCSGTTYCSSYNSDGSCYSSDCCSAGKTVHKFKVGAQTFEACCSAGSTPYCSDYNSDGSCASTGCCSAGKTGYKLEVGSKTFGRCCASGATLYCSYYNSDGSCRSVDCCGAGNVHKFEVNSQKRDICCSSGSTPYCSRYNSDGSCSFAGCCAGTPYCSYYNRDGSCLSADCCDGTPYCSTYNSDGSCKTAMCCHPGNTVKKFKLGSQTFGACCASGATPYCSTYNSDGSCASAGCCAGTPYCYIYNSDGSCATFSCCRNTATVRKVETVETCCYPGTTPYCREYKNDGSCKAASCCTSNDVYKFEVGSQKRDVCCLPGHTPYCVEYNSDGSCKTANCCDGTPYCYSYNSNGSCASAMCCHPGNTAHKLEVGSKTFGLCCASGATPYCYSYNKDGSCASATCCGAGNTVHKLEVGSQKRDACCPSGSTPYCSTYNFDGSCASVGCCNGTPYYDVYDMNENCLSGACCPTGSKTYCNKYENGKCVENSCGADCKVIKTYDDGVFKQDVCCKTTTGTPQCTKRSGTTCIQAACI